MRKIAAVAVPADSVCRLMIHDTGEGVYLYLYSNPGEGPGDADEWYESLADADAEADRRFQVGPDDWQPIDDPVPGAQHDWIRPTRVRMDSSGNKLWGQFEPMDG